MRYVVVCEVALDERNGAGIRAVLPYLLTLPAKSVGSLFLFKAPPHRGCPEVQYCRVPYTNRSGFRTLSLVLGTFFQMIRVSRHRSHFIILPNSIHDLLMGVVCTLTTQGGRSLRTVWMMDDFMETYSEGSRLERWLYPKLFKYLYKNAHQRIVVSKAMDAKYRKNYGFASDRILGRTLSNSLPLITKPTWNHLREKQSLKLVYLGTFLDHYFQPLETLKQLLQDERTSLPVNIEIDLFGLHPPDSKWLLSGKIQYRGCLKAEDLQLTLKNYDFGIIPYTFSPQTEKLMMSSFPSKLIEYLGASLPAYIIAPGTLTFLETVRAKNIGLIQTECSQAATLNSLGQLLNIDRGNYQLWQENAHHWAEEEFLFDAKKVNQILTNPKGGRAHS